MLQYIYTEKTRYDQKTKKKSNGQQQGVRIDATRQRYFAFILCQLNYVRKCRTGIAERNRRRIGKVYVG